MNTEYKGFDISFKSNGVRIDTGRYHVEADGFNADGYATLNAARGAITKHLNALLDSNRKAAYANPAQLGRDMAQLKPTRKDIKFAVSDDKDRTSLTSGPEDDVGDGERAILNLDAEGYSAISSDLLREATHTRALLRYHGYGKHQHSDKRSRNKREGHLDGYVKGKTKRGLRLGKPLCLWSVSYGNQFTRKQRKHYNGF